MKQKIQLFVAVALIALLQACGDKDASKTEINTNSPDGALMSMVQSLKNNDVNAIMKLSLADEEYNKAVSEFENKKGNPSESDKAQFAQTMQMLTSEGAVDQIMAMVTPQLEQIKPQLSMALMMGKGMVAQGVQSNSEIPEDQKETVINVANAMIDFLSKNDVLSEEITRKAVTAAVDTAKSLNVSSLDELQAMSFDQAMGKAGVVLGGFKNVIGAYGISIDDMLDSIEVSDVQENGDSATMKVAYEFLGQTFSQNVEMVKLNDKWTAKK